MPQTRSDARGLSLTEALIAALIFCAAIVPAIALMGTSQRQVTKVQERLLAVNLVMSVVEEMRARRPGDRASFAPVRPDQLPQLAPLLAAHRALTPAAGPEIDFALASFRVGATVTPGQRDTIRAEVTWTEAGEPESHALDAQLDAP